MNRSIDTVTAGTSSVMPPSQVTERWPLAMAPNQEWIAIYHSTDDPLIPVAEPRFVAKQLQCSYFELDGRGHFTGARDLPEVLPYLKRKLAR